MHLPESIQSVMLLALFLSVVPLTSVVRRVFQ